MLSKTLQDASESIYSLFWSGQFLAAAGAENKVWVYDSGQDFWGLPYVGSCVFEVNWAL